MNAPAPLEQQISEWLATHGYPLEMKVARALKQAGFGVVQSEFFEDPETGKPRETDVVAYEQSVGAERHALIALIAECKGGSKNPWLLFTADDPYPPGLCVGRTPATEDARSFLFAVSLKEQIRQLSLFAVPTRPGYSLARALTRKGDKDTAYEGLMSVTKAAKGFLARLDKPVHKEILPYAVPFLVVDGPLFEVYLGNEQEPTIAQIPYGLLIWRNPISAAHSIVRICTFDTFSTWSTQLRLDAKAFTDAVIAEALRRATPEGTDAAG